VQQRYQLNEDDFSVKLFHISSSSSKRLNYHEAFLFNSYPAQIPIFDEFFIFQLRLT